MKAFLFGLWALAVSLGAAYAVAYVATPSPREPTQAAEHASTAEKTRVINVPVIANGAVQGFIVAQFGYTLDPAFAKKPSTLPEVFILDEAFRTIYSDDHLDFKNLKKYDLNGLTQKLLTSTNDRLGAPMVKAILIQDFAFIAKGEGER